jgi:hypothetical protein
LHPNLSISGQILSRKAGATDGGKLRLDYGLFDYQLPAEQTTRYGLRLGRVRNALGFYNESRDVVFTRPSILLPQSAYLEGTGVRELVFSSDGGQLYADWDHDTNHTSVRLTLARDETLSHQTLENLFGPLSSVVTGAKMKHPVFAQILHEMDGGRERLALSYVDTKLSGTLNLPPPFGPSSASVDAQIYMLSAQYNAEDWSLTSEYTLTSTRTEQFGSNSLNRSDGIYLQFQYRFTPEWTGLLRQDIAYADRNDRSNDVSRDSTIGLSWAFRPEWLLSTEYHQIGGTGGIPLADNRGRQLSPHTRLLAVMLGYRF